MMLGNLVPALGGETVRVDIDKKALFALASDTRLDILRSLQPMRRTVTQIAEALDIDKAAVHRHLQKLVEGDLVRRYEDHGFVYYGLSWKARDLLAPNENTKIIVHLSAFFWAIMGTVAAVAVAAGSSTWVWQQTGGDPGTVGLTPDRLTEGSYGLWEQVANPASPLWIVLAVAFAGVAAVLLFRTWRGFRGPRQRGATPEPPAS